MSHINDRMNDFQHTELNSLKTKNTGGGGWSLHEFGHSIRGDVVIVRCVRYHADKKVRRTIEYEIDARGVSTVVDDREGTVI